MRLIKREGSPFWWYDFSLNGVRYKASTKRGFDEKEAAQSVLAVEYNKLLNKQQFGTKPEITVKDAFDRVLKTVEGKTRSSYELCGRKWLGEEWVGGEGKWALPKGLPMSKLTQDHLDDHRSERMGEGLRPNSVNVEIRVMQLVYNASERRFACTPDLEFTKLRGFVKTRFLSDWEVSQIIAELSQHHTESYRKALAFFLFLKGTGARLGEGLNARWADLNMSKRQFEVYRIKTKSLSLVPLPDETLNVLRGLHNQKAPFMEMTRAIKVLRRAIDKVCNVDDRVIAQRGKATIHSIRDTYGSKLVSEGMSLHELAKLLGHSTAAMSAKYGHLESSDVVEKARRMLAR